MKGDTNPLTDILLQAQDLVNGMELDILEQFGIPLYTKEPGKYGFEKFPADPEAVSPEEMQQLINVHGEENVNQWLLDHYTHMALMRGEGE